MRNHLVWSFLRSQADEADAEDAIRKNNAQEDRRRTLDAARVELLARRKALLDHCAQHGC